MGPAGAIVGLVPEGIAEPSLYRENPGPRNGRRRADSHRAIQQQSTEDHLPSLWVSSAVTPHLLALTLALGRWLKPWGDLVVLTEGRCRNEGDRFL